jgi:hypothetical protein
MADLKSLVHDYVPYFKALLVDIEALTGLDMNRDLRQIEQRTASEGLSFLTKTLPSFYKHTLWCVEEGSWTPIVGFKRQRKGPLPCFLGGLVRGLFEDDGSLKIARMSPYLGYIGQLCTFLYKCEFPYTKAQEAKRLRKFKEVEEELPEFMGRFSSETETILLNAIELARELFHDFEVTELPRHGPGAVADGAKAEEKYNFQFSDRIDEVFPYEEWFWPNLVYNTPDYGMYQWESKTRLLRLLYHDTDPDVDCKIPPARGIFVNKDSRGPRYISAEPKELMWLQQAVGRSIMRFLEKHPLTEGTVNFSRQGVNARLALLSSISRKFATIDLEDASDRVSLALVRLLLPSRLVRLLEACRSDSAVLPDGSLMRLKKFAPMGSACCFPIESVVFWLLATACVEYNTGRDGAACKGQVYVYGDDIIIIKKHAPLLKKVFGDVNLVINERKSFVKGPFRESCGMDAIDGIDISTVKLRRAAPLGKADVSSIISWTETSNLLFYAGFWRTAQAVLSEVENHVHVPYVPYQSGAFGKTGLTQHFEVKGKTISWDKRYQLRRFKTRHVKMANTDWSENSCPSTVTCHALTKESRNDDDLSFLTGKSDASTMTVATGALLLLRYGYQWLT